MLDFFQLRQGVVHPELRDPRYPLCRRRNLSPGNAEIPFLYQGQEVRSTIDKLSNKSSLAMNGLVVKAGDS